MNNIHIYTRNTDYDYSSLLHTKTLRLSHLTVLFLSCYSAEHHMRQCTRLFLLKMGIMMPETCWDRSLIINIRLFASCWFLSLHPKYYIFWVCVCSLRCATCNAHASYCHLLRAPLYNIFPHYLIKDTVLEKKVSEHKMCVLVFSTNFVWNVSPSKRNWARCDHICMLGFM